MSEFKTPLLFEDLSDDGGPKFRLYRALVYQSDLLGTITVPEGFITDLASIPRFFHRILTQVGGYDKGAVVHDLLYRTQPCTREIADKVLLEAMVVCGVSPWKRWLIYAGLRVGGWLVWNGYTKEKSLDVLPGNPLSHK